MIANMVTSLKSDSDAKYVQVQAYVRQDEETLHIQGVGPQVNRDYGISADINLDDLDAELVDWIIGIPRQLNSKAGSDKRYFTLQMRYAASVNHLNFQIPYGIEYNRPYGANFSISADTHPKLKTFWENVMNPEPVESFVDYNEIED